MMMAKPDGHMQKNETGYYLSLDTKSDLKWISDLNIRSETKNF